MAYSPKLSSAFNDTYLRSNHISPQSGMCSFCTEECDGTCEIALASVLGKQTVYPTNTGNNQVASEKDYPIDFLTLTSTDVYLELLAMQTMKKHIPCEVGKGAVKI